MRLEYGGSSRARNIGAAALAPSAEYILFLESDDLLESHAADRFAECLDTQPEAGAVLGTPTLIDAIGAPMSTQPTERRSEPAWHCRRSVPDDDPRQSVASMYASFQLFHSGVMIRRSTFERSAQWDQAMCRPARPFHVESKDLANQLALLSEVHRLSDRLYYCRIAPTGQNDSFDEGLKELHRKWWHKPLTRVDRRRVRRAVRFKARVAMLDVGRALSESVLCRSAMSRREATGNLAASLARWATLPVRLDRAGPPTPDGHRSRRRARGPRREPTGACSSDPHMRHLCVNSLQGARTGRR